MCGDKRKRSDLQGSHPNLVVKQGKKSSGITWKPVPSEFYSIEKYPIDESKVPKQLKGVLSKSNYCDRFHTLLYLSEICDKRQALKNLKVNNIQLEQSEKGEGLFKINLGDDFDKNRKMREGDSVHVKDQPLTRILKGRIRSITNNNTIHVKFNDNIQNDFWKDQNFSLTFYYSRINFIRAHNAIDDVVQQNGIDFLFPKETNKATETKKSITFYDTTLNKKQQLAVEGMLSCTKDLPYILFGPPGTGKTVTLTELIIQLLETEGNRLLVCAPSNRAVENIFVKLLKSEKVENNLITRFISLRRFQPMGDCYCNDVLTTDSKK